MLNTQRTGWSITINNCKGDKSMRNKILTAILVISVAYSLFGVSQNIYACGYPPPPPPPPPHAFIMIDGFVFDVNETIYMHCDAIAFWPCPYIVKIEWDFDEGEGFVEGDADVTHSYSSPGEYCVMVRVWDNCGRWGIGWRPFDVE
jgi:hypothetical protein